MCHGSPPAGRAPARWPSGDRLPGKDDLEHAVNQALLKALHVHVRRQLDPLAEPLLPPRGLENVVVGSHAQRDLAPGEPSQVDDDQHLLGLVEDIHEGTPHPLEGRPGLVSPRSRLRHGGDLSPRAVPLAGVKRSPGGRDAAGGPAPRAPHPQIARDRRHRARGDAPDHGVTLPCRRPALPLRAPGPRRGPPGYPGP